MKNQTLAFTKQMAVDLLEDRLTVKLDEYSKGQFSGLVGGFYLSGIFTQKEWGAYLTRAGYFIDEDDDEEF
jgi:hypothetical protein